MVAIVTCAGADVVNVGAAPDAAEEATGSNEKEVVVVEAGMEGATDVPIVAPDAGAES